VKLLLDENLPHDLRHLLTGHDVFTVAFMEWKGVKNGELLRRAAAVGFDAVITNDSAMEGQQDTKSLPLAVVILGAPTNDLEDVRPLVPRLLGGLRDLKPRTIIRLE
jgi:hypothetical protein